MPLTRLMSVFNHTFFYAGFFLFFSATAWLELNVYDDGIILSGAQQIIAGNILYQDYWTLYSPAQFYVTALLLKIFGTNAFMLKAFGLAVKACLSSLFFCFLKTYTNRIYAFFSTLTLLPLLAFFSFDAFPVLPALALILAALLMLQGGASSKQLFLAGILIALAGSFRHDLAVYAMAGVCLYIWLVWDTGSPSPSVHRGRACVNLAAGAALIAIPVLAFMLYRSGWSALYESFLQDPAKVYAPNRQLPWPSLVGGMDASVYFPYGVAAVVLALFYRSKYTGLKQGLILLCLVMLCLSLKGWVRTGFYHMLQALVPALILFYAVLYAQWLHKKLWPVVVLLLLWGAFVAPLYQQALPFVWRQTLHNAEAGFSHCWSSAAQPVGCLRLDADYSRAIDWLVAHTQADDCVYIGPARHDKVFVNAVAGYFLAQRLPCTRWAETHPGLQTRSEVQQAMRDEMSSNRPAALLLDSRWDAIQEPNESAHSTGVKVLDQWIHQNYRVVDHFGTIQVWQPRDNGLGAPL